MGSMDCRHGWVVGVARTGRIVEAAGWDLIRTAVCPGSQVPSHARHPVWAHLFGVWKWGEGREEGSERNGGCREYMRKRPGCSWRQ